MNKNWLSFFYVSKILLLVNVSDILGEDYRASKCSVSLSLAVWSESRWWSMCHWRWDRPCQRTRLFSFAVYEPRRLVSSQHTAWHNVSHSPIYFFDMGPSRIGSPLAQTQESLFSKEVDGEEWGVTLAKYSSSDRGLPSINPPSEWLGLTESTPHPSPSQRVGECNRRANF